MDVRKIISFLLISFYLSLLVIENVNADSINQCNITNYEEKKYCFDTDGKMQTGFQEIEGKTYFFSRVTGELRTGIFAIDGPTYYFDETGVIQTGLQEINGKKYYFGTDGKMQTGFREIDGKTYFFSRVTGELRTGMFAIDGTVYNFDETGVMQTGLREINGKKYYFGTDGKMQTGFQEIEGKTYFFSRVTGELRTGIFAIDGTVYYFDENGIMQTGTFNINGIEYTFGSDGKLKGGWQVINGSTYYLQSNGYYLTGWHMVMGEKCFFNSLGQLIGRNVKRIIDVSKFQGEIDWYALKNSNTVDGVILRIGLGSTLLDEQAKRNIQKLNELNIPYGIYLFSYAENSQEAIWEADYTNRLIKEYGNNPTLGVYLDIEKWTTHADASDNISQATYEAIITTYINRMSNYGYTARVYTGKNYALNRLTELARSYVTWIAQYNYVCNYPGSYRIWQYGSEYYPGINGAVDTNVMFN